MKAYFLSRQLREKILIIGLVAAGLAVWVNHLVAARRDYYADNTKQTAARKTQLDVLNRADAINAEQRAIVAKLDPIKTIRDENAFDIILQQMAQEIGGITATPARGTIAKAPQLTIIRKNVTFRDLDPSMSELFQIYRKLNDKAPYINIVSTTIMLNNGGGRGGGRGNTPGAGAAGGGFTNTNQPGGAGGRGGGRANTTTGTIGQTDVAPTGGGRGGRGGAGGANGQTLQPVGPRLNVTFGLSAISIAPPGANARPGGAPAPARSGAPAPSAVRGS